jgi:hypothetical protein
MCCGIEPTPWLSGNMYFRRGGLTTVLWLMRCALYSPNDSQDSYLCDAGKAVLLLSPPPLLGFNVLEVPIIMHASTPAIFPFTLLTV